MNMKYKRLAEIIFGILVILFLGLYISQMTGYYQYAESKKTTLTTEAIKRFEEDIRNGKEIRAENYLEQEVDYSNKLSSLGMKLSSLIEKGFNKAMNSIFNEISNAISDE